MKGKLKILILILSIIVIILIATIVIYKSIANISDNEGKSASYILTESYRIKQPDNRSECFTAMNIAKEYINYLAGEEKEILMNVVSSEYIKESSIKEENILEKVKDDEIEYSENYYSIINKIYIAEESITLRTYFIDVLYYNQDNNQKYNIKIMLQMDGEKQTYQIIPYQYMKEKKYNELTLGDMCNTGVTSIEKNEDNTYSLIPVSKKKVAERYFNLYLDLVKYDKEQSYYLLNEEYRQKRFENIEDYMNYVDKSDLSNEYLDSYQVIADETSTRYICIDTDKNYYIFNEKSPMNFDLMIDIYTIDSPEFIEKYDSSEDNEKVALNIEKLIEATKNNDYKYIYSKLDYKFKSSNFKTQEDFEKFVKERYNPEEDTVSYEKYENKAGIHIYNIQLIDESEKKIVDAKVVMQLKDNRQFVFSFSVES